MPYCTLYGFAVRSVPTLQTSQAPAGFAAKPHKGSPAWRQGDILACAKYHTQTHLVLHSAQARIYENVIENFLAHGFSYASTYADVLLCSSDDSPKMLANRGLAQDSFGTPKAES